MREAVYRYEIAIGEKVSVQVKDFISKYIRSVWQLELLILLSSARKPMSPTQIARELYMSRESIEKALTQFANEGLLKDTADGYIYSPDDDRLVDALNMTSKAYLERRSSVINLIFAGPSRQGYNA